MNVNERKLFEFCTPARSPTTCGFDLYQHRGVQNSGVLSHKYGTPICEQNLKLKAEPSYNDKAHLAQIKIAQNSRFKRFCTADHRDGTQYSTQSVPPQFPGNRREEECLGNVARPRPRVRHSAVTPPLWWGPPLGWTARSRRPVRRGRASRAHRARQVHCSELRCPPGLYRPRFSRL